VVPDALSRLHTEYLSALSHEDFVDLNLQHFNSVDYKDIKEKLIKNQSHMPDVKIIDNVIYSRTEHTSGERIADDVCWKLLVWITKTQVSSVLKQNHECLLAAHSGINISLERIRRMYY